MSERSCLRDRDRATVDGGLDEDDAAFGILENELERFAREPGVDRDRNGAGTHRAEEDLEKLDAVADDHADALAGSDAELGEQSRYAVGALIELRVSDQALETAVEIDHRDLVRKARHRVGEKVAEIGVFGFIQPDDGSKDVFVHVSAVESSGLSTLNEGQKVQFELVKGKDGKTSAGNLKAA